MITVIGEILIDRFEEYERIGGAPFNFAYHLKHMGWPVRFITRIGDDPEGSKICKMLASNGFDMADVQIDKSRLTGRVDVTLDSHGVPQFDIRRNAAYDHIDLSSVSLSNSGRDHMIYYGTLIQRTNSGHEQTRRFLDQLDQRTICFCDINFRAPHINPKAIENALHHADILKLNDEELNTIRTQCKGPSPERDKVDWLIERYDISMIVLTHGAGGGTAYTKERASCHCAPERISHIVDTVGAGDAYASVLAAGRLKQLPLESTLKIATRFAARICTLPGAIPEDHQVYADLQNKFERILNAR